MGVLLVFQVSLVPLDLTVLSEPLERLATRVLKDLQVRKVPSANKELTAKPEATVRSVVMAPRVLLASADSRVIPEIKVSRAPLVLSLLQASKASRDPQDLLDLPAPVVKMVLTEARVSSATRDRTAIAA